MNKYDFCEKYGEVFVIVFYGTLSIINGCYAGLYIYRPSHGIVSFVAAAAAASYALYRAFQLGTTVSRENANSTTRND